MAVGRWKIRVLLENEKKQKATIYLNIWFKSENKLVLTWINTGFFKSDRRLINLSGYYVATGVCWWLSWSWKKLDDTTILKSLYF